MAHWPDDAELPALTPVDRTPRKRRGTPEDDMHRMIWRALLLVLHPEVVAYSVENRANGAREGGRRKGRGVIAGVCDMHFFWPMGQCALIELKVGRGDLSDAQEKLHARLLRAGVPVRVCRSLSDVTTFLRECGVPMRGLR